MVPNFARFGHAEHFMEINFADQQSLIATLQIYVPQKFGAIPYPQAPLTRDNECVVVAMI